MNQQTSLNYHRAQLVKNHAKESSVFHEEHEPGKQSASVAEKRQLKKSNQVI